METILKRASVNEIIKKLKEGGQEEGRTEPTTRYIDADHLIAYIYEENDRHYSVKRVRSLWSHSSNGCCG